MKIPCSHCLMVGDVPMCHALACVLLCDCPKKLTELVAIHGLRAVQHECWYTRGRAVASKLVVEVAQSNWRLVDLLCAELAECAGNLLRIEAAGETDHA